MLEEQNMIFIYKGHFCDQNNQFSEGGRLITVGDTDYDDLYTFVKDMDILITDYSSIYFDFLLCHKPIILFPFDIEDYVTFSRPFYFNYDKLEGKKVYSWSELEKTLRNKDYNLPSEETIAMFNKYIDGDSSKRLFNTLRNEQ
jgi:CDP-glycerol glycerophosphotransferase